MLQGLLMQVDRHAREIDVKSRGESAWGKGGILAAGSLGYEMRRLWTVDAK